MSDTSTAPVATLVPAGTWRVDPAHSSVEFGIKHVMVTTVKGQFGEFEGEFEAREDGGVDATARIKTASIDTNEPKRDEHLRSPDFFDASSFPEITFRSKQVEPAGDRRFRVQGELTIRDLTHELELEATVEGPAQDPWGNQRVGLELRGSFRPADFGITWNQELESGGSLIGDRVTVAANVSAVKAG